MRKAAVMQYDSTDEERTVASGHTCYNRHQQSERTSSSSSSSRRRSGPTLIISQPNPDDILCGKEKHCIIHDGTRRYRKFIDAFQPRYNAATTKQEKMEITKEIVTTLGRTARFLRYNKELDAYEELSHLEARDKTSHALRTACKRISKQQKKLTSSAASSSPMAGAAAAAAAAMARAPAPEVAQQQKHAKPAAVLSTPLVLDAVSSSGVTTGSNTTPNHRQWQSSHHRHHPHHHHQRHYRSSHHQQQHHHHQQQQRQSSSSSASSNERYHYLQRARFHRGSSADSHVPLPIHSNQQMDGALFDDLMTLLKDPTEPAVEESE